jgi:hypothetical protein
MHNLNVSIGGLETNAWVRAGSDCDWLVGCLDLPLSRGLAWRGQGGQKMGGWMWSLWVPYPAELFQFFRSLNGTRTTELVAPRR